MKIISIITNTNLMSGFCYLFNEYWGNKEVDLICYSDEFDKNKIPNNFNILNLGENENLHFSNEYLINYIENIPDKYITLLLDDFYLISSVNPDYLNIIYNLLETNIQHIHKFDLSFNVSVFQNKFYKKINNLEILEYEQNIPYRSTLQAAIWDKKYLLYLLKKYINQSIWVFEEEGSKLLKNDGKLILGCSTEICRYANISRQGKLVNYLWIPGLYPFWGIKMIPPHHLEYMRKNKLINF